MGQVDPLPQGPHPCTCMGYHLAAILGRLATPGAHPSRACLLVPACSMLELAGCTRRAWAPEALRAIPAEPLLAPMDVVDV